MTDKQPSLVISLERINVWIIPGRVLVELDLPRDKTGLVPGLRVSAELEPSQARAFGQLLLRKADEAESAASQQ